MPESREDIDGGGNADVENPGSCDRYVAGQLARGGLGLLLGLVDCYPASSSTLGRDLSLIVIAGAWLAALGNSEFAKMAIVFGIVGSGLLYLAGREEERDGSSHETKIAGSVTMGRNR
jgi:hypothetical protein